MTIMIVDNHTAREAMASYDEDGKSNLNSSDDESGDSIGPTNEFSSDLSHTSIEKHSLYNVKLPFPFKLHEMLDEIAAKGGELEDIVSWQPHGKAFRVHNPDVFAQMIMPRYFKQNHYKSFQRQLHIYGFHRITGKNMKDNGSYYHRLFIRGKKNLCLRMTRQKIKGTANALSSSVHEPDFYAEVKCEANVAALPTPCISRERSSAPSLCKLLGNNRGKRQRDFKSMSSLSNMPKNFLHQASSREVVSSRNCTSHDVESQSANNMVVSRVSPALPWDIKPVGQSRMVEGIEDNFEDGDEIFFEGKRFFFVGGMQPSFHRPITARRA